MRLTLRVGLILAFLVGVYLIYTTWVVFSYAHDDQARPVDAIVVLGSAQYNGIPSADLKARLDHAAALYRRDLAKTVVVTGGKLDGDDHTEASASAAYLGKLGIPDSHILREVQGRNSWSSLQAATRFMKARDINSVLLVSDAFHNARIHKMSEDLGLDAYVSATHTSPISGMSQARYYVKEIAEMSVGQIIGFQRIAGLEANFHAS